MALLQKQLYFLALLLTITFTNTTSEPLPDPQDSSLLNILEHINSKISSLELRIDERTCELRNQDERISQLEMIIHEKSESITSLHSEKESRQLEEALDVQQRSEKSHARVGKLEEQEEIMKPNFEADSGSDKLTEVHGEWHPHWLAIHLGNFQECYIVTYWNEHGRPTLHMIVQQALEMKAQLVKWAEHQFETISTYLRTCIPLVIAKRTHLLHAWKKSVLDHVINAQEMVDPYLKEAKKFTQPYINQVATKAKPHFDKLRVFLKPYTRRILQAYKNFVKSTSIYHHQVQQMLKNNELTRPFATMDVAWFAATALLAIPVLFMCKLCLTISSKKAKKHRHSSHIHHSRRGSKRSYAAR